MRDLENKRRLDKERYHSHKEKAKQKAHGYYLKNQDAVKERVNKYRLENREKINEQKKKYREEHREEDLERKRKYRLENPEKVREGKKRHRLAHPEIKLASDIRHLTKLGFPNKLSPFAYGHALTAWSKTVKKLGNGLCLVCNVPAKVSHHIIHKSKYPGLSLNVNNGIPLCKDCHDESHGWNQ
jgi:5-methylcytosine-specific restriction endonuclease McrA